MNRRNFLSAIGAATAVSFVPRFGFGAQSGDCGNLLVLIELKGGNDGLNTVIPYADREYYALRPRLAVPRDQVLQLDARTGLHPALASLMALWRDGEMAIVQRVGYPAANLSHFRSIEIWDTASKSNEYLSEGWLARTFARVPAPRFFAADGVVAGGAGLGPFEGAGARTIMLADAERFMRQAKLVIPEGEAKNGAFDFENMSERDIVQAAASFDAGHAFRTEFPHTAFGNAVRTAAQVAASRAGVVAMKLSLNGFDTHCHQPAVHARLLQQLADGLVALRSAFAEIARWDSTLVMTYAEFGRCARENQSGGTDHGTASAHFVLGGKVKGGLYGPAPDLNQLDGNGNLLFAVDFRDLYVTVLERWWGMSPGGVLGGRFRPVALLKA